jgi:GTP cyclohydrolase I
MNRAAMESAVAAFLRAAGVDAKHPDLIDTPSRVAEAWANDFLDGYAKTPQEALGELYPAPQGASGELVLVTDLRFHSSCPHHLLPYQGRAHLAYVPKKHVVGFGRLSTLLDCFAHRLVLQEELARNVARAMAELLGSPGTACILEAEQGCLRLRGECQREATTHAEAYEGRLRKDGPLRQELWARLRARP